MAETVNPKNKIQKLKEFIQRLQRLEDGQKKKWLIGLTVIVMIAIIGLWLIYLATVGLPAIAPKNKKSAENAAAAPKEDSSWEILKRGWKEISNQAGENFKKAGNLINEQIEKSNEIILNNNATSSATTTAIITATTTQ